MELKPGDFVVHEQHGIGRFIEMRQRTTGSGKNQATREYLVIEYAPSKRNAPPDKLFIPTDQLDQVSEHIGAEIPKLNKLGGSDWAQTKAKAKKHVHEIAQNLIRLYSARQRAKGLAFQARTPRGRRSSRTPSRVYQETADQLTTIDDVKADMEKPIPMGSSHLRRRRLRQDRDRDPRRVQGGAGFQAGGCARADDPARAAASADLHRTF